jgi:hypothetical protein
MSVSFEPVLQADGAIKAHGAPVSGVAFHPTKPLFVSVSDACWRMWSV